MVDSCPNFETPTKRQFGLRGLLVATTGICCMICMCTSQLDTFVLFRGWVLSIYLMTAFLAFYYLIFATLLFVITGLMVTAQFATTHDEDARNRVLKTGGRTLRLLLLTLLVALLIVVSGRLILG